MSHPVLPPPGTARPPSRLSTGAAAILTILLMLLGTLFVTPVPAQAATLGVGYGNQDLWLGSFATHGRQAYCMDIEALPPWGNTQHPELKTALDDLSSTDLARLNYVMGRWGESSDPNVTAAVQMYVWDVADHGNYVGRGGDAHFLTRVPQTLQSTVLANLNGMREAAVVNAVANPAVSLSIVMSDQYQGQLTVTSNTGAGLVSLSNATFADGSTTATLDAGIYPLIGTPPAGAPEYQVQAAFTKSSVGIGAGVDLFYTPGEQRLLATGSFKTLIATGQSPAIPLDFQPVIETVVASKFVQAGDPMVDQLAVSVTKHSWISVNGSPVPVLAEGTLYGPFDAQPAEANAPPEGAPVVGREQLTLTKPGTFSSPGTLVASESGLYTWVWQIDKTKQGGNTKYLTDSFVDRFGRVVETAITPFQPEAVSKANGKLVKPGDRVTDTITVSSTNGVWLKHNGEPIPVMFEGTAYQVPGTLPPVQGGEIPVDAVPIGTVTMTATGPGTYMSPEVELPDAGFVTWVWKVAKASQPEWVRPYIASDWADEYGINIETHSVRWPVTITSEVREYNVHKNGRAFDRITVTGFPDNHPEFEGDGYWAPDEQELVHTVYGPFKTDEELTDDLDLEDAPVLTTVTTPAKNGVYDIGYGEDDRIQPTDPGFYVIVTTFAGDDRVQPYSSSPADIWERFFVPGTEQPVSVITQAQETAYVGDPFDDTALVQGSEIPDGAYLIFRAYGPQAGDEDPVCEVPFFVSEQIAVTQAGHYRSGTTTVEQTGNVYWVETLYDEAGEVIAVGKCGAPGETTVVTERPPGIPPTPPMPEQPPLPNPPTELAQTGGNGWMHLVWGGIALSLIGTGATLWFGRRLALHRERNGYVREEDRGIEELLNE